MSTGVVVKGLHFSYPKGESSAVSGVDLSIRGGELVVIVGPSGSGKTTLLRLITGLVSAEAGRIEVGGKDVTLLPPEQRPVAMVFQGYALFPHLTVAANIGFGLSVRKVPKQERDRRVRDVAERLGITGLLSRRPAAISGGERQRVALARAILRDPIAFCLDEPLSSLDPQLRTTARRDLDASLRQDGRCAIWVTHDQSEAMTMADRVGVMRDGKLEQVGTPHELYHSPATVFVASFMGSPPMNLLTPGIAGVGGVAGAATIGVRAEHVRLTAGDDAGVLAIDDLGYERIAELDVQGETLLVRMKRDVDLVRGQRTGFQIDREQVHSFGADGRAIR